MSSRILSILNSSGKMPSDKKAICNQLAFSMPVRANTKGKRLADFITHTPAHHPLKKDRIILNRQLKQKGEKRMNSLSPLLLPAIESYNFMGVPELGTPPMVHLQLEFIVRLFFF